MKRFLAGKITSVAICTTLALSIAGCTDGQLSDDCNPSCPVTPGSAAFHKANHERALKNETTATTTPTTIVAGVVQRIDSCGAASC